MDIARIVERTGAFVDRWFAAVPLGAVADLIGIDPIDLSGAVESGRTLAACLGPVPPEDAAARAGRAVDVLTGLATRAARSNEGVAAELRRALPDDRVEDALANTIGLLFQTADATAGLCANTLVSLGRANPQPGELAAVVADVERNDPAVHNTRRWFVAAADIGGATIDAGDAVLVVLAAANRDPAAAGEPLSFGAGVHRCPAAALASMIAGLTVAALVEEWPGVLAEVRPSGYRPLPNVRIPTFV